MIIETQQRNYAEPRRGDIAENTHLNHITPSGFEPNKMCISIIIAPFQG
jgi:hypothetical protein